jgi:hypothetical protein
MLEPQRRFPCPGFVEDPRLPMGLKQVTQICDVHCVTRWTLLDSRWQGISMKTISLNKHK